MRPNAHKRRFRKSHRLECDQPSLPQPDGLHHPLWHDAVALLCIELQHAAVGDLVRVVALDLEEHGVLDLVLDEYVESTGRQDDWRKEPRNMRNEWKMREEIMLAK